ncbi:Cohesin subunit SA-2 [Schistosoma japonicum]|nr:Cohesin subunit SA-2 [Schistosoma japonicum]
MKLNNMAASMDVNLQMDQYHAHHPHVSGSSLSSHPNSGLLQHEGANTRLPSQFGIPSQTHHFGHVHDPYVNSTSSVQQILMQQQIQHQRSAHYTSQVYDNNDRLTKSHSNHDTSPLNQVNQMRVQIPAHQQISHSLQPNNPTIASNPRYSPIDHHGSHHSSPISKDNYNAPPYHLQDQSHVLTHTSHMQQPLYPYHGDSSQIQNPQTTGHTMSELSNSQYTGHHLPMQINNSASGENDIHHSGNQHPQVSTGFQAPSVPYIPPTKKRRGRPPTHPTFDVGAATLLDEDEHTLYGAIRSGRVAPQTVVDDWIEQYKTNREPAMLELIQFFISCSGCKGKVTPEMYSRLSHADIIRRMTEEFDEDSGEYPLIQSSPVWKRFRSNFVEFIQVLIRQCQYSIIYDQCMIDQVISLLTGLTDSQVRAFRHTSTLAAMKMMTALVDVALNVSINRDNTQRQYEAERSKVQNRRASDRLEVLMQRRQELEENMEEVKNMLIYIFKGVFVHRYRDSQAEIRTICMQEIGVWMRRYPAMFLDDSYLKYVGWTLYDRIGDVRLHCLRALQPLYEDPSLINSLELFTSRFKSRLVDMTLDKETEVAVQAVKLVSCILKHSDSVLEDKDCENIYELVYCTHRPLAQAAGEFLTLKLFEVDSHAPPTRTRKGKKRSENTPLIRDLVQFFIESELHEHATYLVDSLWDLCPMLRDWEAMLDLLLEEPGRGEEPMDANQETSLIEIMVCCVRQAATGESPVGRQTGGHHSHSNTNLLTGSINFPESSGRGRGGGTTGTGGGAAPSREARALAEERSRMTEAMITALPALLAKYGESPERATNLLAIPRYMEMELYTTGRHERHLDLLLQAVQDIVERHTDPQTLLACSRVYESLCIDELSIASKCQTVRGTLLDRLVDLYRDAFLNYFNDQGEEPDQDDEFHLLAALKRIYAFFACHDLSGLDLWDSLIRIAQSGNDANGEIVAQAVSCCSKALLWNLARIGEVDVDKADLSKLRRQLNLYMDVCIGYLDHSCKRLASESFLSICDLLVVFSRHLSIHLPNLKPVIYTADRDLELKLTNFLEQRVFVDDDDLAAFFKLVIYNLIPIRAAAPIYKYYIRSFNDFGDIMKSTLAKAREINRVHTARMIAHCLELCYLQVEAASNNYVERGSEGLQAVKELARRLNLSFGLDLIKIRESMVAFHSEGIQFCVSRAASTAAATGQPPGIPSNLLFLEVVAEFSNKLLRQDKKSIYEYLRRIFPNPIGSEWASLHAYRSSLDPDNTDTGPGHDGLNHPTNPQAASSSNPPPVQGSTLLSTSGRVGYGGRGRSKRLRDSDSSLPDPSLNPQSTSTAIKKKRTNFSGNPKNVSGNVSNFTATASDPSRPTTPAEMPSVSVDCAPHHNPSASMAALTTPVHSSNQ